MNQILKFIISTLD